MPSGPRPTLHLSLVLASIVAACGETPVDPARPADAGASPADGGTAPADGGTAPADGGQPPHELTRLDWTAERTPLAEPTDVAAGAGVRLLATSTAGVVVGQACPGEDALACALEWRDHQGQVLAALPDAYVLHGDFVSADGRRAIVLERASRSSCRTEEAELPIHTGTPLLVDMATGAVLARYPEAAYYDLNDAAFLPSGRHVRLDRVAAGTCGTATFEWWSTSAPFARATDGDVFWPVHELSDGRWLGWGVGDEVGDVVPGAPETYRALFAGAQKLEHTGGFSHFYDSNNVTLVESRDPQGQVRRWEVDQAEGNWTPNVSSGRWVVLCHYAQVDGAVACRAHDVLGQHPERDLSLAAAHRTKRALAGRSGFLVHVAPATAGGARLVRLDLETGASTELAALAGLPTIVGDDEAVVVLAGTRALLVEKHVVHTLSESAAALVATGRRGSALAATPQSSQVIVLSRTSSAATSATRVEVVDLASHRIAHVTDHGRVLQVCGLPGFVSDAGHPWLRSSRWIQVVDERSAPAQVLVLPADLSSGPRVVGPAPQGCDLLRVAPDGERLYVGGGQGVTTTPLGPASLAD